VKVNKPLNIHDMIDVIVTVDSIQLT